jgi:hypothetical protein
MRHLPPDARRHRQALDEHKDAPQTTPEAAATAGKTFREPIKKETEARLVKRAEGFDESPKPIICHNNEA